MAYPKPKKPIKLIATDLDGTLLNPKGEISARTLRAMRRCEERGVRFVMASGRTFEGIRTLARKAGLNSPIISCNGGRVDASPFGPALLEDTLPPAVADEVFDVLAGSGLYMECYGPGALYLVHPERSPFIAGPEAYAPPKDVVDADGYVQRYVVGLDEMAGARHHAYKFAAFSRDPAVLRGLTERLAHLPVTINSAFPFNIEIMEKGRGKGHALTFLAERLGLERDELMAFGDGTNDLEMLQAAGTGVAMGNAAGPLRRAADLVAPTNAEDGEAEIIEKLVLGE